MNEKYLIEVSSSLIKLFDYFITYITNIYSFVQYRIYIIQMKLNK